MKKIVVQGGYTKGGYEFNVLETPSNQTYKIEQLSKFEIGSDTYWHGYITGKELKSKKLPIDANPRKPGPTKIVHLMQATIQKDPLLFHHLNNGITIVASKIKHDEATATLSIKFGRTIGIHGDGICNGGHSYFAIEQYKGKIADDMLVRVEILVLDEGLTDSQRAEKIKTIAEARNSHNQLENITIAHYSGYYDKFIDTLGNNKIYFKWFEGDPDAVKGAEKIDALIAKLSALSPHWYSHYLVVDGNQGNHMSSARNTGSTHSKWVNFNLNPEDEKTLVNLRPLIDDVLKLRDEVSYSLMHDDFPKVKKVWRKTRLWQYLSDKTPNTLKFKRVNKDEVEGFTLSHTFFTMLLGAFRENVWFSLGDDGVNLIGWLKDPIELWHTHRETYMNDLNSIANTISAPSFGNALLQNAALYTYQFTRYEYGVNLRKYLAEPEIVYDTSTFEKYEVVRGKKTNIQLNCEVYDEELPPFAEMISSNENGNVSYRKCE
jgi:hypothetical protein